MGEKKRRLDRLFKENPNCCFCAGEIPAETVEHAPPKAFFRDKIRLKGLEFPACKRCNNGSSQLDQVASWFAIGSGCLLREDEYFPYWMKLSRGVKNNTPEVLDYLGFENSEEVWWVNQNSQIEDFRRVLIDRRLFSEYLNPWAAKQGFALWYHHTERALGENARVWVRWMTNEQVIRGGEPAELREIANQDNYLKQGKLESASQYFYRFAVNDHGGLGLFFLGAHEASGVVIAVWENDPDAASRRTGVSELFATTPSRGIHSLDSEHAGSEIGLL